MPDWINTSMDPKKMSSTTSFATEAFLTHHASVHLLWRRNLNTWGRASQLLMLVQGLKEVTMEPRHNVEIGFLSTVMVSRSANQTLPEAWMIPHDVLPLLESLPGIRKLGGMSKLGPSPDQIIPDKFMPLLVFVEESPRCAVSTSVEKTQMSKSANPQEHRRVRETCVNQNGSIASRGLSLYR
jgi:hypothetical protein